MAGIKQNTVTREGEEVELRARGRHDACVVPRAGVCTLHGITAVCSLQPPTQCWGVGRASSDLVHLR
jgi:hypothetical protein